MYLRKEQLNLAGWLSITNALFTIPSFVMSWFLESIEGAGARLSQAVLVAVSLGLFLYIISSLKKLLNFRFEFHEADSIISLLIWGNVTLGVLSLLSLGSKTLEAALGLFFTIAIIGLGILSILFATRLLRLPDNLYGLLKPFCYTTLASGICLITVILLPAGIIAGAIADVILGVIFFRAAEQPLPLEEMLNRPIE